MFTGIIEKTSKIINIAENAVKIENVFGNELKKGDSIAINGSCLTVTVFDNKSITFDLLPETYKATIFRNLKASALVNLERAMLATSRFDGHIVTGHVDGVGEIIKIEKRKDSNLIEIKAPKEILKYLALKGSVAVNGISLTIQDLKRDLFSVAIIPTTFELTNMSSLKKSDGVNLEVDIIARYTERMLDFNNNSGVSYDFLRKNGF